MKLRYLLAIIALRAWLVRFFNPYKHGHLGLRTYFHPRTALDRGFGCETELRWTAVCLCHRWPGIGRTRQHAIQWITGTCPDTVEASESSRVRYSYVYEWILNPLIKWFKYTLPWALYPELLDHKRHSYHRWDDEDGHHEDFFNGVKRFRWGAWDLVFQRRD